MEYTQDDLIEIETSTGSIFYFDSLLQARSQLIQDFRMEYPDVSSINLGSLTADGVRNLFIFLDQSRVIPSSIHQWYEMLLAADYLNLIDMESQIKLMLNTLSDRFLDLYYEETGEDPIYYTGPIGSTDLTLHEAILELEAILD